MAIKNKKNNISLSVVVPIYNEINLLEKSLYELNSFLDKNFNNFEIIIIESGSTDGSDKIVDQVVRKLDKTKVFHQKKRYGFGSALKMGFKKAAKDYVWLVTVDFPFPLKSIFNALPLLNKYDFILSYRLNDPRNRVRHFQSIVFNWLAKKILYLPFKNINSAFKVFKTSIIKDIYFHSNGWLIETEILYFIHKNNFNYVEIPIPLIDRKLGKSKISILSSIKMFIDLLLLKSRIN